MVQYSLSRNSKQKPQRNDDIFEVIMTSDKHGNILEGGGGQEFLLNVSRGLHPDITLSHNTGYIQATFGNGDTIWEGSVPYPWSALATAQTLYVKSSTNNEADRGSPIVIVGLDANYEPQEEVVIINETNSTTAVATTKQFLRINSTRVNNGVTNQGDITVHVTNGSGTTVDIIPAGFGRSMTAAYTVPAGYTGYLMKGAATSTGATVVGFYIRYFGEGFKVQHIAITDNSAYIYDFPIPLPFPEKTDMDVRGIISNGRCVVNWDLLLYKNGA